MAKQISKNKLIEEFLAKSEERRYLPNGVIARRLGVSASQVSKVRNQLYPDIVVPRGGGRISGNLAQEENRNRGFTSESSKRHKRGQC